jgi:hypothetical protein
MMLLAAVCLIGAAAAQAPEPPKAPAGFEFIDTGFENASPLWYEPAPDGTIMVHLM